MPLKVVVTILPRQGKEERTWEQLHWLASQVKQHEPNVTSYRYGRNDGTYGEKGIVVVMECVSFCSFSLSFPNTNPSPSPRVC